MRVLVTGATGFVGSHICRQLLQAGHDVTGLSRRADPELPLGVTAVRGDVVSGEGLATAVAGADAVIHLVGIIAERGSTTFEQVHVTGTKIVVDAAGESGVERVIHMSALGARLDSPSEYQSSKARGEELVRASGLQWTIMRPSLIFGVGDGFFGGTLRELVTKPPLVPVVGTGEYLFRPVWIGDVAAAFARALERPATSKRIFELVGPREHTLRQLLVLVRGVLGSNKPLFNVPLPLMHVGTALFSVLPNPPITRDQLQMLLAGNTGDPSAAVEAFDLELTTLEERLPEILD